MNAGKKLRVMICLNHVLWWRVFSTILASMSVVFWTSEIKISSERASLCHLFTEICWYERPKTEHLKTYVKEATALHTQSELFVHWNWLFTETYFHRNYRLCCLVYGSSKVIITYPLGLEPPVGNYAPVGDSTSIIVLVVLLRVSPNVLEGPQDSFRDGWWRWQVDSLSTEPILVSDVVQLDGISLWGCVRECTLYHRRLVLLPQVLDRPLLLRCYSIFCLVAKRRTTICTT